MTSFSNFRTTNLPSSYSIISGFITLIQEPDGFRVAAYSLFVSWLIFLAIFVTIERKHQHPMLDLSLFANKLFSINLITGFITFVSIAGTLLLIPFYLENILKYNPQSVGLLLGVVPVGIGIMAPISGNLSDKFGTRKITLIGLICLIGGYGALCTLDQNTDTLGYLLRFLPVGLGMGIFQSPNNSAVMGSVPKHRLGIASSLLATTRTLGQVVGIALIGAFWSEKVSEHFGKKIGEGATQAPAVFQIEGLHDTFRFIVILISLAAILSLWGLLKENELKKKQSLPENQMISP